MKRRPDLVSVLSIGGLDPSGGAGILMDAIAVRAAGCHCAAVCSLMTLQNGLEGRYSVPRDPDEVLRDIAFLRTNETVKVIKTGALYEPSLVSGLSALLAERPGSLVIDPVFRSTSGLNLGQSSLPGVLLRELIPLAALVTPNLAEAEILCGFPVTDISSMESAASRLLETGADAVLVKGGHLEGDTVVDVLATNGGFRQYRSRRIRCREVRGTGCALAALCAAHIALGHCIENAVERARDQLQGALSAARFPEAGPGILFF